MGAKMKLGSKDTTQILRALRHAMKDTKYVTEPLHAYIIPSEDAHQSEYIAPCDARRAFVSGFTGSRGEAVVTETQAALWTDGRYFLQAREQMDSHWELMKERVEGTPTLSKFLLNHVPFGGRVGVDPKLISGERFRSLRLELGVGGLVLDAVADNLVDIVWGGEKPKDPNAPLLILSEEETGCSWQNKLDRIRKEMKQNHAKLLVLSALDEIAWTFNLRGEDIDFNPVFFSYAIISEDSAHLFMNESKASQEVREYLCSVQKSSQNGLSHSVSILPYENVLDILDKFCKEKLKSVEEKVWLPLESTSQAVSGIIPDGRRLDLSSPVLAMKAIKNSVEMAGLKNAHLKDGVAHCEFLHWLESQMKEAKGDEVEGLTEVSAAKKFQELRQQQDGYISLSFDTISSVGSHAAVIHYSPSEDTDVPIRSDKIYLTDSGGQYRDGTTDVTRTICFKDATQYQKECNTSMVKGHIALAMQAFPEGTTGIRLDSVARLDLWNRGLDFRHGVGHGVGHFLNVHEGPASMGYRSENCFKEGIKENYVLTIEPGYYEDGEFGCRLENVYAVVKAETKHSFPNCRFLTFESMTLVPIDTKLLEPSMLTAAEVDWINSYHERCLKEVGPLLEKQGKHEVHTWLVNNTKPLN